MQVRRAVSTIALSLGLAALGWTAVELATGLAIAAQPDQFHLEIIAFNDFHGNLESPGKFRANADSPLVPAGGIDYLAGYVEHLKSLNPDNIVVSAGDLTGGGPLISALFHEEDTVEAMDRLGLEINSVGNHEFDKGKQELLRLQHGGCAALNKNPPGTMEQETCKGAEAGTPVPFEGAKFEYLAANVIDTATGKTIFPGYAIRTWHGVKVAFIGVTLKDTPANSTASAMAGLRFTDEADSINAIVRQLRGQGVKSFVALIHQGGFQTVNGAIENGTGVDGCDGDMKGYPIRSIVGRLDDAVDLVLSAHTHIAYVCQLPNSAGRKVTVTSASSYGRVLTQIDLTIDTATKAIKAVTAHNIVVDRTNPEIKPDAAIESIVDRYAALAAPLVNRVVGSITANIPKTVNEAVESPMGDLLADAQLEATASPQSGGAVAAFMNGSGFRIGLTYRSATAGVADGKVTYGELFEAQPFGNILVTMSLTGAQIKTMLEEQFKGCAQGGSPGDEAPDSNRMLLVSEGFTYAYSKSGVPCSKVDAGSIKIGGATVSPSARYRITVNSFLADGGGQFYVLKKGTDRRAGPVDIDATIAYFARHPTVAPGQPDRVKVLP